MAKCKFYNRVRSIAMGFNKKSSDRLILDVIMVSPLANGKFESVDNKNVKKRTLKKLNRGTRYR